ncbi:hypothetical protein BV898_17807 [Hypsibius exemplaris]|uniref:Uncharacterized protein n=1 Tax=Hypsibius exemplaris TaxID=2072580 RepID=A0A9X6RMH5_HYPEX|nr:hypothetical protein BV898_17807 [Hypsibius exemplaris]
MDMWKWSMVEDSNFISGCQIPTRNGNVKMEHGRRFQFQMWMPDPQPEMDMWKWSMVGDSNFISGCQIPNQKWKCGNGAWSEICYCEMNPDRISSSDYPELIDVKG